MQFLLYSEDPHTCEIVAPVLDDLVMLCRSLPEAKEYIRSHEVKAFLIDLLQQEEEAGLSLAHYIREIQKYVMTPMIFLAMDGKCREQAYKEFRCYDYLNKAVSPSWLRDTLIIMCEKMDPDFFPQGIYVHLKSGSHRFEIKNILYVEILNKQLVLHTHYNVYHFPYRPIRQFIDQARGELVQCHRSMAVNRKFVERIDYQERVIYLRDQKDRIQKVLLGPKYMQGIRNRIRVKGECDQ